MRGQSRQRRAPSLEAVQPARTSVTAIPPHFQHRQPFSIPCLQVLPFTNGGCWFSACSRITFFPVLSKQYLSNRPFLQLSYTVTTCFMYPLQKHRPRPSTHRRYPCRFLQSLEVRKVQIEYYAAFAGHVHCYALMGMVVSRRFLGTGVSSLSYTYPYHAH